MIGSKMKMWGCKAIFAAAAVLATAPVFALGASQSGVVDGSLELTEIRGLSDALQAWLSGDLGMLILMVAILVAVIMVIARASLMPILFVLGLAIILGWAPMIFSSILTAEVSAAMLLASG